ncbi:MAG: glutathione S-transferase N-terminal domain-containing protein [Alphaproteobacteria bacterium]|nr:glutathione S-transferase N-terminal domain-containing protein [Alphaproteobacteria bacterium]MDP6238948.1 glutathione S-transferase N-terminal domain-containing protein [Alphaproteobacteria bacterium]MDP7233675.1 glutathione S-transferase N-terminal domain-containing protein [Alphaproteobacteria bacterium]MDP7488736.1 glutathione S-transferase N-terminal domain-containing protein [Alphaproteobacteria bacterium]
MIDLYFWPTPNGWKITIMLEELGLPYKVIPVEIGKGDQFKPEFLAISPNNKMPAIVDLDGPDGEPISIFESGAIMIYLAEKTGKLMPADPRGRIRVLEWLMFQMGTVGPMLGQAHHFRNYAPEQIDYAVNRYTREASRIYQVIDTRLADNTYLAGDEYSIADIAVWPWLLPHRQGQDLADLPNLKRWRDNVKNRPAVIKGREVMKDTLPVGDVKDDKERFSILFGDKQYTTH